MDDFFAAPQQCGPYVPETIGTCSTQEDAPNLTSDFALARAASISRSRGSAVVTRDSIKARAAAATSCTARSNAARLALEGLLNPLSLRTNCSEDALISSSVAGGSKLKSVLMLRHMVPPYCSSIFIVL